MTSEWTPDVETVLECLGTAVSVHAATGETVYQNAAHRRLFGERVGRPGHPVFEEGPRTGFWRTLPEAGEHHSEDRTAEGRVAILRVVRLPEGLGYLTEVTEIRDVPDPGSEMEAFVQQAAHDLKTPLVSIKGYAELLQRELGGGEGRAPTFLERLILQAHRMEGLLEELLDYARIGTDEVERRELDPAQAARSVWCSLQDLTEPIGAVLEIEEPLPPVRCSPVRFQQLLTNLLTNALRHRRNGIAPRVRLQARGGAATVSPGQVLLVLEDNGPGIAAEDRERVFSLFHRGSAPSAGTGVGLAIVRRIVEENGGAVWIEPGPAGGSRFVFGLPSAQKEEEEP